MASCRCGEIRNWEEQIRKLQAAKSCLGQTEEQMNRMNEKIEELIVLYPRAFICDNLNILNDGTENLNNAAIGVKNSVAGKISSKIGLMLTELSNMKSEDNRYHEEEAQRQREEEERQRQAAMAAVQKQLTGM